MIYTPALIKQSVKNPFYARFGGFGELQAFAKKTQDLDIAWKCRVVQQLALNLPTVIQQIQECCVGKAEDANWIVTTAHKAKGLEFDTVRIASDFPTDDPMLVQSEIYMDFDGFHSTQILNNVLTGDEKNLLVIYYLGYRDLVSKRARSVQG